MRKQVTAIALFFYCTVALCQADSAKKYYMYSMLQVNAGWGVNINPPTQNVNAPFWGTNGPTVNISALFALKESYWGIAAQLGYSAPAFNIGAYSPPTADTNPTNMYTAAHGGNRITVYDGSATHYTIYYLLGGLGLKLPQHTTQQALELRLMVGPLVCTQPALSYSVKSIWGGVTTVYSTTTSPSTAVAFAMSPGLGIGEKLTRHIAIMAYADILYASFRFNINGVTTSPGNAPVETTENPHSGMVYLNLSACISYSFGSMTPNITY